MTRTTDQQYADMLARLSAIPAQAPQQREMTRQQDRKWMVDDLMNECGEAVW